MGDMIHIYSTSYYLGEELEYGNLKEFEYKDKVWSSGAGGDWPFPLANILNNEIIVQIATEVAVEVAVSTIKTLYSKFKDKKSPKTEELRKNKKVIITGGKLVIKVEIDGQYVGAVGEENIDLIDYEFMNKIMKDYKKNQ